MLTNVLIEILYHVSLLRKLVHLTSVAQSEKIKCVYLKILLVHMSCLFDHLFIYSGNTTCRIRNTKDQKSYDTLLLQKTL